LHVCIEKYVASSTNQKYLIILVAILVRACVGLTPYSGENDPPKYGDFECHRVWMEVTYNLPVSMWYNDTPYSNSTYWPIDYPPLCAYTHLAMANVVNIFQPNAILLGESQGYNRPQFRTIMRSLMIALEILIFVPALI
jgi:alpha-1,3-glucosyltransferase